MTGPAPLRPMRLRLSIALFGGPMLLVLLLQRVVVPALDARGVAPLVNFYVLALPHLLFFCGALVACRLEGNSWSRPVLASRLRLKRLGGRGWAWALLATVGLIGGYLGVFAAARPILEVLADAFPEPVALGRIMGDEATFAGYPLSGNAWLLGAFLIMFFFNVVGEELWWRGYIFPRQARGHPKGRSRRRRWFRSFVPRSRVRDHRRKLRHGVLDVSPIGATLTEPSLQHDDGLAAPRDDGFQPMSPDVDETSLLARRFG